jgi:hypothetical protein
MDNSFYAERYLATIEVLKKHGLWNLEIGLLFMPIIQHCMPAPSIHKIHQLLSDLANCEVDTDWAPSSVILKLKKEVARHIHAAELTSEFEQQNWGTDYAIAFGIHRIAQQRYMHDKEQHYWPTKLKSEAIEEFVETVYENMGAEQALNKDDLYSDIYQLRDVLIVRYAEQNCLGIYGRSKYHIQDKQKRISNTLQDQQGFGNNKRNRHATPSFWKNPPNTQFCIQIEDIEASTSSPKKADPDEDVTIGPSDDELMKNNTQQRLNLFSERPRWVRNNVRSLADANQLSWANIFQYWEFLLTKKLNSLFKLSLTCFLTGIHKKRWINGLASHLPTLDSVHLFEENNELRYKLNGGSSDFLNSTEESNVIQLYLFNGISLTKQTIRDGLKDESAVRSFNRRYSGPSPTLNNVCRSGHALLRKTLKGETLAFIMSGRVPIEFKARSAYLATDSDTIQDLFNNCLLGLKKEVRKRAKQYPLVNQAVAGINASKEHCGLHSIGSQLATPNWHFGSFKFHSIKIKTIEAYIERTNQMVLYFYWMVQYSLATRPAGEKTESFEIGDFWLHKDKDSDRYFESKVLFIPDLLKKQKQEVQACITDLKSFANSEGFNVEAINTESNQLYYYKFTQKEINQISLLSSEAIRLSKQTWGITPMLERSNAYRHQCASYIHRKLGENHADTWLGHHIDGWCYSAPESAANANILSDVLKTQNQWLEELGFHLIKNPLS